MSIAAALLFGTFALWFLSRDSIGRPPVSRATWIVVAWLLLIGSRPVSAWFDHGIITGAAATDYDEGNPLERSVYFVLIALGLGVVVRRGVQWKNFGGGNVLLLLFFLYWALSIVWADAPFVAFKRWIKDAGNLVMVIVVLSDLYPLQSIRAVLMRSSCILIVTSVFLIRFAPTLGRTFHTGTGEMMYTGVATHKNSLGVLALVCLMFFLWSFFSGRRIDSARRDSPRTIGEIVLIVLAGWLLLMAGSATALGCAVVGASLVVLLSIRPIRASIWTLELLALVAAGWVALTDSTSEVLNYFVVDLLGRDMTLTTRTDVWPTLLGRVDNIYIGAGFNSFWTGERLADIYEKLGIIQAHNGYLETYLNGGLIAAMLLAFLLLGAIVSVNNRLRKDDLTANFAFAIIVVSLIYNLTEASFDKTSLLWFILLLTTTSYSSDAKVHVQPAAKRFASDADQLPRQFGILPWS